jgi:hypothetical protein
VRGRIVAFLAQARPPACFETYLTEYVRGRMARLPMLPIAAKTSAELAGEYAVYFARGIFRGPRRAHSLS